MRFKVFISSVQREFAAERQMLAEYVRKDALLGKFFDVFLFEEEPRPAPARVDGGDIADNA